MRILYGFSIFLLFYPGLMQAQNLVQNPSFEYMIDCPTDLGGIENALDWFASRSTPDYFQPCANSNAAQVGVPVNFFGNQQPLYGDAYSGIYTYVLRNQDYREYLGTQLLQPLTIGTEYYVSAYISKGDSVIADNRFDCPSNRFGFRFSTVRYSDSTRYLPVDNFCHVRIDSMIINSTGWSLVSGTFVADSAYQYLNIGNFYTDVNTTIGCNMAQKGASYYYIDGICVSANPSSCTFVTSVAPAISSVGVTLSPNPAVSILQVKHLAANTKYKIFTGIGSLVQEGSISKDQDQITVSGLGNGFYYLHLENATALKFEVLR